MTKKDTIIVFIIFVFTLLANIWGFKVSYMRERDSRRILDIGIMESGLRSYFSEYGSYPLSTADGRMLACPGPETAIKKDSRGFWLTLPGYNRPQAVNLVACEWGKDRLGDPFDLNYPAYVSTLPKDPRWQKGFRYYYRSDGVKFEIYGHLELKESTGYNREVKRKNIKCGNAVCNILRSG